jgi:hypothetical protein
MNMIKTAIAAATLAFALSTGAIAQTPPAGTTAPGKVEAPKTAAPSSPAATTTAKTAKAAKVKTPAKPRSEVSMACSKELDAKNVHGKERAKQMKTCKAAGAKTEAAKKN